MLSIGKLAPGRDAASYYLDRVAEKSCPLDYYTGAGEAPGAWIGRGAERLGLDGTLTSDRSQGLLRDLLDGIGPDGQPLAKPVLRSDPRGRVPTLEVVQVVTRVADEKGLDVEDLLTQKGRAELVKAWARSESELDRAQRRPMWPAPAMPAATAQELLKTVGLDLDALPSGTGTDSRPRKLRDRIVRALRHADDKVDVRLPGLDLTLSAPKSVSVLYALADASPASALQSARPDGPSGERRSAVASAVQAAHRTAVQAAVDYVELSCTDALRGHHKGDGTDRTVATDGFVGAAFEHRSSRCGDPQLHTHVVVANLLHGQDGKWSALNTREIYAHAKTAGYVYQAVLRGELTDTLGVEWDEVRNGQADIAGMPKPLLRMFSKRRVQIEEALDRLGLDGPKGAQIATLNTRTPKGTSEETRSLRERWQAEASDAGHDLTAATSGVLHCCDRTQHLADTRDLALAQGPAVDALADRLLEPTGLTGKRSTLDRKDLLRGVCEHLPAGARVSLNALRATATTVLRDPRVIPLLGDAPVKLRRYSTQQLIGTEQASLEIALGRLDEQTAVVPASAVAATVQQATQVGLSEEQTAMLQRLLSSGAGVEVVVGAAGSGKTAALRLAAQAWTAAGLEVRGTALAAIAARVLTDSAQIPATSLQRLLNSLDTSRATTTSTAGAALTGLPPGGVLIVDEAGMVGTRTLHRLLAETAAAGTKLVLVGDPRQLPEIDAGGLFATLASRLPSSTLTGNQRQHAKWEQRALRELREGDVTRALRLYDRRGRLRITDTIDDLTDTLLENYEKAVATHRPEQVLVIASSRRDARRLNAVLRQRLLDDGRLGDDELHIALRPGRDGTPQGTRGYRVGEQVLVTVNDYPRGLLNGCRGTVTALHLDPQPDGQSEPGAEQRGAVTVRLDDGRHVHLDHDYLTTGQLTHGYALTAHKAQGTTVDVALLWGTQVLTRETGYVAMSRGREANTLYSTWDLLARDTQLDAADLDRPAEHRRGPDVAARRLLARAAVAERLTSSGRQRTARSWWRPRTAAPDHTLEPLPTSAPQCLQGPEVPAVGD